MIVGGCGLDLGEGDGLGVVLVCFGLLEFSGFFLLLLFVYFFAEAEFFFVVVAHEEFGEGFGAVGLFAEFQFGCDEAVGGVVVDVGVDGGEDVDWFGVGIGFGEVVAGGL